MISHEELIEKCKANQVIVSGEVSVARDKNINTTMHYFSRMSPNSDWTTLNIEEFKELYSKMLTADNLKDSTKSLRSRYLLMFFRYLVEEGINTNINLSALQKMKCHRAPAPVIKESEILTEKQVNEILTMKLDKKGTMLPEWMRVVIALLFGGGMRISEVLRLKYGDVTYKFDNESGRGYYRISVDDTKTDKRRTTFVNRPYLMEYIKKHISIIKHDENVNFVTGTDEIAPYSRVRYWFDKIRKCGYPDLTSHKGRKHNISRRIASSEPISTISLTTHGVVNTPSLKHYLRLNESEVIKNMMKYG